jgi:hypothetical protein
MRELLCEQVNRRQLIGGYLRWFELARREESRDIWREIKRDLVSSVNQS